MRFVNRESLALNGWGIQAIVLFSDSCFLLLSTVN